MQKKETNASKCQFESLRSKKFAGPGSVCNEHPKGTVTLEPWWTALFNRCSRTCIPSAQWRNGTLLVVPKASMTQPSSLQGIARKSVCFNLFSGLLTKRLGNYLKSILIIPTRQRGFRRERSKETTCRTLMVDVKRAPAICGVCRFQGSLSFDFHQISRVCSCQLRWVPLRMFSICSLQFYGKTE